MELKLRFLGPLIFILILLNININDTIKIISSSNLKYWFFSISLLIPMYLVKAWKWRFLITLQGIDYSLKNSFIVYWIGIFMGMVTPGRLGNFIRVFYLQQDTEVSLGTGFWSVFVDRLSDILVLVFFGIIGAIIFVSIFGRVLLVLSLLFLIISITLILCLKNKTFELQEKFYLYLIPEKFKEKVKNNVHDFYKSFKFIGSYELIFVIAITMFYWIIYFFQMYLLTLSLGIDISFFYVALCVSISGVLSIFPLSISGIGTRDATFVVLFSLLGLSSESAISFSIMVLSTFIVAGFGGLLAWLKKPIEIK